MTPVRKTDVVPRYRQLSRFLIAGASSTENSVNARYPDPMFSDSAIRSARHASARWLIAKILGSPVVPELVK